MNALSSVRWQQVRRGALLGGIAGGIVLALWAANLFAQPRLRLNDVYFVPGEVSQSIVIVAIDDASLAAYGRSLTDWPRTLYADLTDRLNEAQARVVAFDVLFADPTEDDERFIDAIEQARAGSARLRTVMAAIGVQSTENLNSGGQRLRFEDSVPPTDRFANTVDYLGYVNAFSDTDGVIRRQPSLIEVNGAPSLSFSLATYLAYLRIPASVPAIEGADGTLQLLSGVVLPIDEYGFWMQNYFGPPNRFPVVSFQDVVSGNVEPSVFTDKIVLVGMMNVGGSVEQYAVPSGEGGQRMAGVEIHANAIETLLQNRILHEQSSVSQAIMIILLAVMASVIYTQLRWYWIIPAALLLLLGWLGLVFGQYNSRLEVVNLFHSTLALTLPVILSIGLHINTEIKRRQKSDYLLESVMAVTQQQLALDKVLSYIAADVQRLLSSPMGGIWLAAEDDENKLTLVHYWPRQSAPSLTAFSQRILAEKRLIVDQQQAGIPFIWQGRLIAVVAAHAAPNIKISAGVREMLQELSDKLASSLENAVLHSHIQRQKTLLEAVLLGSPTGILVLDHEQRLIRSNTVLRDVLALDSAGRQTILDLLQNAKASEENVLQLQQGFENGEAFRQEVQIGTTTYSVEAAPLTEFRQWVVIFTDVTVLAELNKLKTRMIRLASHDLKNPLTRILGYGELLIETDDGEHFLSSRTRQFIERIITSGEEMSLIITDILNTEQLRSTNFERLQVDLQAITADALGSYEPTLQHRHQTFTTYFDENLPPVLGNPRYLRQAVTNLISNATKYTPEGGHIMLRLHQVGDALRLEVEDNGYGMSAEAQKGLFTEFYRIRTEATMNITGTGLGLSLVKWIVEAHGGRIWVKSEDGAGSTFFIELPIIQEAEYAALRTE